MLNMQWELIDLRVFCCVARRSSFNAAAVELGISPAYVSKRVAGLEQALGLALFHRTTRRVSITDEGETALLWARKVLDTADSLTQEVGRTRATPSGTLRISTSLRLGRNHVGHILAQLKRLYPALDIWLELVDRRVDVLGEGFDIDIRVGDISEPYLVAHPVANSVRVLCAAPSYLERRGTPKTLADLAQHDCLLFRDRDQAYGVWRLRGPQGVESVKVTSTLGSNHSDAVHNWAVDGHGIVLLSSWDVAARLKDGSMQRVLPAYHQQANVWALTATRLGNSAKLKVCVDYLVQQLQKGAFALEAFGA
jgi:LysR family transcriptional activator of dmlA